MSHELVGRFQQTGDGDDPNVAAIRRMSDQVVEAIETLAGRQAEIWKIDDRRRTSAMGRRQHGAGTHAADSLRHCRQRQPGATLRTRSTRARGSTPIASCPVPRTACRTARTQRRNTSGRLREGLEKLAELLIEALERHGEVLTTSEKELAEENRQHLSEVEAALGAAMVNAAERQERLIRQSEHLLKEMQVALVEAAGATVEQQEQLIRQSDVLLKVVDATGQIARLEESLTQNLTAVQKTHNFEEMAINLSAAIQLLSARLGQPFGVRTREVGWR